jgi:hypothetical protein
MSKVEIKKKIYKTKIIQHKANWEKKKRNSFPKQSNIKLLDGEIEKKSIKKLSKKLNESARVNLSNSQLG